MLTTRLICDFCHTELIGLFACGASGPYAIGGGRWAACRSAECRRAAKVYTAEARDTRRATDLIRDPLDRRADALRLEYETEIAGWFEAADWPAQPITPAQRAKTGGA